LEKRRGAAPNYPARKKYWRFTWGTDAEGKGWDPWLSLKGWGIFLDLVQARRETKSHGPTGTIGRGVGLSDQ